MGRKRAEKRESEERNRANSKYYHPMRGVFFAIATILLFLVFLVAITALIWWIA